MSESTPELSPAGDPIYHHKPRQKPFELAAGDEAHIKLVENHIAKYIGTPSSVFHELISDLVHIDIQIVPPNPSRNFYTLVTCGMSMRAMTVPPGAEDHSYAELLLCLPPDWPLGNAEFKKENNYWPIRLLKFLARMPHEYQTWLGVSHTIPMGNPPVKIANTEFCGAIIAPVQLASTEFQVLKLSPEMQIHFYAIVPLYNGEMDLKLKMGAKELFKRFDNQNVSELVNIKRRDVSKKFLSLF